MILVLLGSGFRAGNSVGPETKATFLRVHVPVAVTVLLLTVLRIAWWWRFELKPQPARSSPL